MSREKPRYFIANKHTNRISHRKLSAFEEGNPGMFELSHAAFDSWDEAHAWLIERCVAQTSTALKELQRAERRLARARLMRDPEAA